jgi:hypothetical protein
MRYEMEVRKNGRIGHQYLREIGVIPSPEEKIAIAAKPSTIDKSTRTPFELAEAEDEHGQINRVAYGMACAMEESARIYGTPLPTAEEYRRLRRIAEVADELSGGRFHEICHQGGPEEKRIRQLATVAECEEELKMNRRTLQRDPKLLVKKGLVREIGTGPTDPTKYYEPLL